MYNFNFQIIHSWISNQLWNDPYIMVANPDREYLIIDLEALGKSEEFARILMRFDGIPNKAKINEITLVRTFPKITAPPIYQYMVKVESPAGVIGLRVTIELTVNADCATYKIIDVHFYTVFIDALGMSAEDYEEALKNLPQTEWKDDYDRIKEEYIAKGEGVTFKIMKLLKQSTVFGFALAWVIEHNDTVYAPYEIGLMKTSPRLNAYRYLLKRNYTGAKGEYSVYHHVLVNVTGTGRYATCKIEEIRRINKAEYDKLMKDVDE